MSQWEAVDLISMGVNQLQCILPTRADEPETIERIALTQVIVNRVRFTTIAIKSILSDRHQCCYLCFVYRLELAIIPKMRSIIPPPLKAVTNGMNRSNLVKVGKVKRWLLISQLTFLAIAKMVLASLCSH